MKSFLTLVILATLTILAPGIMLASALVLLVANRLGARLRRNQPQAPRATAVQRLPRRTELLERRFAQLG